MPFNCLVCPLTKEIILNSVLYSCLSQMFIWLSLGTARETGNTVWINKHKCHMRVCTYMGHVGRYSYRIQGLLPPPKLYCCWRFPRLGSLKGVYASDSDLRFLLRLLSQLRPRIRPLFSRLVINRNTVSVIYWIITGCIIPISAG